MSFFSSKKKSQPAPPRPKPAVQRAPAEDPAGDAGATAVEKRKKRRRGLRTVLTQGEQTNLGATGGKSLLGA